MKAVSRWSVGGLLISGLVAFLAGLGILLVEQRLADDARAECDLTGGFYTDCGCIYGNPGDFQIGLQPE